MSFVIRAAAPSDLQPLYEMAKRTGGGFTNLPPDKAALKVKLERAAHSFAREDAQLGDDLFVFVLENTATGEVRGTCQIFAQIGKSWPFYSYRIGSFTQYSQELDRTFSAETLTLSTDLEGATEVGGLFLHPHERSAGLGLLLARSRYLFIKMHRARFASRILAELRGAQDQAGGSPFWDGLAGRFFGMSFQDADSFNATHGNQFIADLMPKHPIYTAMLPETARAVIGLPHTSGRAAMRMLEAEGFSYAKYVDIFDGGPTMTAQTDDVASIRDAQTDVIAEVLPDARGAMALAAAGRLGTFRACYGRVEHCESGIALGASVAALLGVAPGDSITHTSR